ncbi:MAG: AbrB/MazE/SpoVT family DNA-binding domain-containing protein [Ruminococcus sp.]|nr:AbrB/MazE/SpoVT family DNA-binding domain-containing protein [Ruminococcus sp.]
MTKILRILGKRGRITIPFEIRQRVGFKYNDVLSFAETADGRSVVVRREKICENCKGAQPVVRNDEVTLCDFLNNLSPEQQRAALVHLSVKWAEKQNLNAGNNASNNKQSNMCELGAGSACWAEKQGGELNV